MYLASAALIFVGVWISINQFSHSDAGKSTVAYSAESKIAMEDDSSEEVLQTAPIPQKEKEEKKQTGCEFQSQGKITTASTKERCGFLFHQNQIFLQSNSSIVLHSITGTEMIHFKKGQTWIHSQEDTPIELHISKTHFPISKSLIYLQESEGSIKLSLIKGSLVISGKTLRANQEFHFSTNTIHSIPIDNAKVLLAKWESISALDMFQPIPKSFK